MEKIKINLTSWFVNIIIYLFFVLFIIEAIFLLKTGDMGAYYLIDLIYNIGSDKRFILLLGFSLVIGIVLLVLIKYILNKLRIRTLYHLLIILPILIFISKYDGFTKLNEGINLYQNIKNLKVNSDNNIEKQILKCNINRFIAHGGGEINGDKVTDSLEALENSYNNGFRYLELDILKTSDNYFVASHDWISWKKNSEYVGSLPPTYKEFKKYKIYNKYTPLGIDDINKWFNSHKEAILVTDKIDLPIEFSNKFVDKKRLMMELFSMKSIYEAVDIGILYYMPTWAVVSRIQGDKITFLKRLKVKAIVINAGELERNVKLFQDVSQAGIKIYIYGKYNKNINSKYFYGRYINDIEFLKKCKEYNR